MWSSSGATRSRPCCRPTSWRCGWRSATATTTATTRAPCRRRRRGRCGRWRGRSAPWRRAEAVGAERRRRRADPRHRDGHRAGGLRHRRPRGRARRRRTRSRASATPRSLTPAIDFVRRQARVELREIGVVAVDLGPGLFTGLRVGIATAKALAQALRVPMIGVSSLDLLAFPVRFSPRLIVAVSTPGGARCSPRFYRQVPGGVQRISEPPGRHARRVASELLARGEECLLVGDGAVRYREVVRGPRRASSSRAGASPTRRPRRSSSWPTPRRCARSGWRRGSSSRCTCAGPTPRSTGRRGRRRVMAARVERSSTRPTSRWSSRRCGAATCGACCDRAPGVPAAVVARAFMGELAPAGHPRLPRRPRRHDGRRLRRADDRRPTTATSPPSPSTREWHRHEIGTRLLLALLDQARSRGASRPHARGAHVATTAPRTLYRRFGFAPAGIRKNYYADNDEDAMVMWAHDIDEHPSRPRARASTRRSPGRTVLEGLT